ncbi:carbohydrate ABC transporter substrate-binding protein, CUT1 family [Paenibacillaceae bacterium GAS479]|nr:carbohydrate ABC transporter substrate-binding protein, CUT1 family [Paenibacillaceae bacterium GAS479]
MRKKTAFKSMALAMAVAMVLAGCSGNNVSTNNTASNMGGASPAPSASPGTDAGTEAWQLGSEPLEYTMYGHYDWYVMPKWGADESSKWIQDNMKVTVNNIPSNENAAQKLNTMIASGSLPDVLWMDKNQDVEKLRQADMLVPFDDYLDKYPNFKKYVGEATINMLRSPDGKIYQFPNWYSSQPFGNAGYVINKKYYEAVGSPKLETTDDFYNFLKAVKEKFPNVTPFNPDLAVDGQGLDILYSAFLEDAQLKGLANRVAIGTDKMESVFKEEAFRESMLYASKLFREKLMTQDAMTQDKELLKERVMTGQVAAYAGASPTENGAAADAALKKKDPNNGYFMIWPIHKEGLDKNKIFPGTYSTLGWNVNVITKSAKDPEKIFAFLDWMTGPEGQSVIMWGPEGKYWEGKDAESFPIITDAFSTDVEGRSKTMDATVNLQWVGNAAFTDRAKITFESTLPEEKRTWESRYQSMITWKTQSNGTEFEQLAPPSDTEEGIIQTELEELWDETRAKALYAGSDEEVLSILDKAHDDAMKLGYQQLLDYKTKRWQENKAKIAGS